MKIFYYVLDTNYTKAPVFKSQEISADEKLKTYTFAENKPSGYYNQRLPKEKIGKVDEEYGRIYLFLLKRNDDLAKEKFIEYLNMQIKRLENHIKKVEEEKRIVIDFKEEA